MGYSTDFRGKLKFRNELSASHIAYLLTFLGADRRDIGYDDPWDYIDGKYGKYWYHIDLEFTEDFSGLKWNDCEKTYELENIINFLTYKMDEKFPDFDFELEGQLQAQGEDMEDRWTLFMKNGKAIKLQRPKKGKKIECPHCEEEFYLEEI